MEKASAVNRRMVELRSLGVTELSGFHPIGSGECGGDSFIDFPEIGASFSTPKARCHIATGSGAIEIPLRRQAAAYPIVPASLLFGGRQLRPALRT